MLLSFRVLHLFWKIMFFSLYSFPLSFLVSSWQTDLILQGHSIFQVRSRSCFDCAGLILAPRGHTIIEWFASRSARLWMPLSVEHANGKKFASHLRDEWSTEIEGEREIFSGSEKNRDRWREKGPRNCASGGHWLNREHLPPHTKIIPRNYGMRRAP